MSQNPISQLESYGDLHNPFATDMDSLFKYLDIVSPAVIEHTTEITKQINEIKREIHLIEKEGRTEPSQSSIVTKHHKRFKSVDDFNEYLGLVRKLYRTDHPIGKHLTHGGLILAVSYLEHHIKNLFLLFYKQFPEALPPGTSIDAEQISQASTLEEAKVLLRFGPVKSVLDRSVWEWKAFITKKMGIELSPVEDLFNILSEIHQRRNLLVHNSGIVDNHYLTSVDPDFIKDNKIRLGDHIGVSINYLRNAIETIYVVGIYLLQACWRKWNGANVEVCNFYLNNQIYDTLCDQKYSLVQKFVMALENMPNIDPLLSQILKVNLCITYRETGRREVLKEKIRTLNWDLTFPRIALAHAVLEERLDDLPELFNSCKLTQPIGESEFYEWPLFIQLRKDPSITAWAKTNLFGN